MPLAVQRSHILMLVAITLLAVGSIFLYVRRADHPMVYYYGAAPGIPGGTAIPIMNPFRNQKDETNAERLIRVLKSSSCEQIMRQRLAADPARICPVLQNSTTSMLIWLDPERTGNERTQSRLLYYDLPESRSRLVVVFGNSDVGWGVNTVSLLR